MIETVLEWQEFVKNETSIRVFTMHLPSLPGNNSSSDDDIPSSYGTPSLDVSGPWTAIHHPNYNNQTKYPSCAVSVASRALRNATATTDTVHLSNYSATKQAQPQQQQQQHPNHHRQQQHGTNITSSTQQQLPVRLPIQVQECSESMAAWRQHPTRKRPRPWRVDCL